MRYSLGTWAALALCGGGASAFGVPHRHRRVTSALRADYLSSLSSMPAGGTASSPTPVAAAPPATPPKATAATPPLPPREYRSYDGEPVLLSSERNDEHIHNAGVMDALDRYRLDRLRVSLL
jgi:hypothetical protein